MDKWDKASPLPLWQSDGDYATKATCSLHYLVQVFSVPMAVGRVHLSHGLALQTPGSPLEKTGENCRDGTWPLNLPWGAKKKRTKQWKVLVGRRPKRRFLTTVRWLIQVLSKVLSEH